MRRPLLALLATVVALVLAAGLASAPASAAERKRDVPSRDQWLADVKAAMSGSRAYVRSEVAAASSDQKLAVNFDIDNTVLATYYDGGGPIPQQLKFAKFLRRQGVAVLFNTGRSADQRASTKAQLRRNGFPVDSLCLRKKGETLPVGKQRCRANFTAKGWTIIANVGNNDTDFAGSGYGQAYVLPNYDGVLG